MTVTPLQRRLLALLMLDPGARAGRLQAQLIAAGWNPKPSAGGVTKSLMGLVRRRFVRRSAVTDIDPPAWRYSLTDKGLLATVRPAARRKVA